MKKLISAIAVITAAVTCISGCGVKKTESGDLTEVTMWSSNSHSKVVMESLINKFNRTTGKENGLNLVYTVKENELSKQLDIAFSTNSAPDLFSYSIEKGAQNGYILPISDISGGEKLIEKHKDSLVEGLHSYKGKVYKLPWSVKTMGLIYNKDMFKAAGIVDENGDAKPPETVTEMVECAKKLTNPKKREYGIIIPLKWSAWFGYDVERCITPSVGYSGYNPANGKYDYSGFKPFLEAIMQMKYDGSCYPGTEGIDNDPARARFAEGNIGMKIGYSWDVGVLNDQFAAKCDWGVAPIPTYSKDEKYLQFTQPELTPCINAASYKEKGDKIIAVYNWLISDELSAELYRQGVSIPCDYNIIKDVDLPKNAKHGWKEFGDLLEISTTYVLPMETDLDGKTELSDMFVNDVWTGKMTIDKALEIATKDANDGVEKYQKLHSDFDPSRRIISNYNIKR